MTTAVQPTSAMRLSFPATVIGVDNCTFSAVTITTASNFSIVPGVNVTGLTRYFNVYSIVSNATTSLTLPAASALTVGWKCYIILYSSASTGVLNMLTSGFTNIGQLNTTVTNYNCCELTLTGTANNIWRVSYSYVNTASGRFITYNSLSPITSSLSFIRPGFYSYSGVSPTNSVNINTAGTPVMIPWSSSAASRYIDTSFFSTPTPTAIRILNTGMAVRIMVVIAFDSTGGATIGTVSASLYFSAGPTLMGSSFNLQSTTSSSAFYVSEFEILFATMTGGFNYEIGIFNNNGGIGTNPTIPESTFIRIDVLSY
jgi:hypothetical protein